MKLSSEIREKAITRARRVWAGKTAVKVVDFDDKKVIFRPSTSWGTKDDELRTFVRKDKLGRISVTLKS